MGGSDTRDWFPRVLSTLTNGHVSELNEHGRSVPENCRAGDHFDMSPLAWSGGAALTAVIMSAHAATFLCSLLDCGVGGMAVRWVWRAVVLIGLVAVVAGIGSLEAQAEGPDNLDALNRQVTQLYQAGRYPEATEIAKRSLSFAEKKFGPNHPLVAATLNNLAELYRAQGLYPEAEPLYQRSLAIREKALGPNHPHVGASATDGYVSASVL